MKLTLEIDTNDPKSLQEMDALLNAFRNNGSAEVPAPKAPKKPEKATPPAPQPEEPTETPVTTPAATTATAEGAITVEQVREKVKAVSVAGKRDAVKKLLTECGAENVTALQPAKFAYFLDKLNEL